MALAVAVVVLEAGVVAGVAEVAGMGQGLQQMQQVASMLIMLMQHTTCQARISTSRQAVGEGRALSLGSNGSSMCRAQVLMRVQGRRMRRRRRQQQRAALLMLHCTSQSSSSSRR
jgi:hypothetical protein